MPERIDARSILAALGGVLLMISLSKTWFEVPGADPTVADTPIGSAWQAFETLDLVLAGLAVAAIYAAYEQFTGRARFGEGWLLPIGLLAVVIVVSQILDPPPAVFAPGATTPEPDPGSGAWLALGGAGAMFVAGVLAAKRISLAMEFDSAGSGSTTRRATAPQDPSV